MRAAVVALMCIALFPGGCAKNRVVKLSERADAFNRSLRWSSLTAASALIADDTRKTVLESLARRLRKSRIVDYSIIDLGLDNEKRKASILVEYSYYTIVQQDLKYAQELQSWQYDSKKKNWFVVSVRSLPEPK